MTTDVVEPSGGAVESKGLKPGALGLVSATVIGVASTAPGYSLAATLGFVAADVGLKTPAVMWMAFVPMAFIAASFFYLNRADPDCGTNFAWVTRAMGPRTGWMGGWSSMVADLIIMPNLAQIAAQYTFLLLGLDNLSKNTWTTMVLGVAFIMVMTWICVVGIELSARTQMALLLTELGMLVLFSVVALVRVYNDPPKHSVRPSLTWLTPHGFGGSDALVGGLLLAVFIYWGWDTATSVNEECEDANSTPGVAGVLSTVILVLIFVVVAFAAQAVHGSGYLNTNSGDVLSATGHVVFGSSGLGQVALKLLIIAILSSAAASCQTTILPAARTALSMAMHRAIPARYGEVDTVHLTPARASWIFGIVSSVWYVALDLIARYFGGNVLNASIAAVGLMIAYYYGQCGIACAIYFRRYLFKSVKNFFFVGLFPLAGGGILAYLFVKNIQQMTHADFTDPPVAWLHLSPALWIGGGALLMGLPLMFWWNSKDHAFFRVKTDPIDSRPPPEGGAPLPPLVEPGAPR